MNKNETFGTCAILEDTCTYPLDCETCPRLSADDRAWLKAESERIFREILEREERNCIIEF